MRKTLGLTQQEFADRLGISRNNIATYETRKSNPGSSAVNLICREFNVNEEWLRTGEGDMFVKRSEEDELAAAVDRLITGESAEFKRRLAIALSTLRDEHWLLLEQKLYEIVGKREDSAETSAPPQQMSDAELHTELDRQFTKEKKQAGE